MKRLCISVRTVLFRLLILLALLRTTVNYPKLINDGARNYSIITFDHTVKVLIDLKLKAQELDLSLLPNLLHFVRKKPG